MTTDWVAGNAISLIENGDAFFKRAVEIIHQAEREVLVETFVLTDDPVGRRIQKALVEAVNRGVWVSLLADGYGSFNLPQAFIDTLIDGGVHFVLYDPGPTWLKVPVDFVERMHRKIMVVDGTIALVGGINLTAEHSAECGSESKQDYAVELTGPVVRDIHSFARNAIQAYSKKRLQLVDLGSFKALTSPQASSLSQSSARVMFVFRDNGRQRRSIEALYLSRIRAARHRITIANSYFFPGYRMLTALRDAVRRGVKVRLLTQGEPDSFLAEKASSSLYDFLVGSGIELFEYWERPLHAKVAAIDDDWATVGSSNMDPLSFSMNMEANVFIRDRDFNELMHERIQDLIDHSNIRRIDGRRLRNRTRLKGYGIFLLYHLIGRVPVLARWLPRNEGTGQASRIHSRSQRRDSNYSA